MQFAIPDNQVKNETSELVEFLDEKITNKPPSVTVAPTFIGQLIKTSIVYVARADATSIQPHLKWVNKCIQKGLDTLYFCARGDLNIASLPELEAQLDLNPKLVKVSRSKPSVPLSGRRRIPSMIIEYERKSAEQ